MNVPEKHRAVAHKWVDGAEVECRHPARGDHAWALVSETPQWAPACEYRVRPRKPSIDWSHVDSRINAIATGVDGICLCYADVPEFDGAWWQGDVICRALVFASYEPGTGGWRDSLVVRPGHTEE